MLRRKACACACACARAAALWRTSSLASRCAACHADGDHTLLPPLLGGGVVGGEVEGAKARSWPGAACARRAGGQTCPRPLRTCSAPTTLPRLPAAPATRLELILAGTGTPRAATPAAPPRGLPSATHGAEPAPLLLRQLSGRLERDQRDRRRPPRPRLDRQHDPVRRLARRRGKRPPPTSTPSRAAAAAPRGLRPRDGGLRGREELHAGSPLPIKPAGARAASNSTACLPLLLHHANPATFLIPLPA